jgi:quercetin dioxygenase-like cupin family protein
MSERLPTFDEFERDARADGADEVLVREWAPSQVVATHSHPFDAEAIVVQGEMWLRSGEETLHLRPGGTFSLSAGTPHDERYGPEGAIYWVARRNPR